MNRKKQAAQLLLIFCALSLCACGAAGPASSVPALSPAPSEPAALTEEAVAALFCEKAGVDASCVLACVLTPDGAYGRAGVVLYEQADEGLVYAAFTDAEGFYQCAGFSARPASDPALRYLGGGAVSFRLLIDGAERECGLGFSLENGAVSFKVL